MKKSRFGKIVLAIAAIGVSTIALADVADAIKARRAVMKANGEAAKLVGGYLQGQAPFDAAAFKTALGNTVKAAHAFSADFDANFPAGSDQGDTKASPDIWKNKDDFVKRAGALEADATAAIAAADKGEADFKTAAGKMFGNCKGCHEKYKLQ